MKSISYNILYNILEKIDKKDDFDKSTFFDADIEKLLDANLLNSFDYQEKSVLGIDIYEYSQFEFKKQTLVPFVFDLIYKDAIRFTKYEESILFSDFTFVNKFIPTGDGGFVIFDNPVQALIFNTIFQTLLHTYNAMKFFPKVRNFVGPLFIRSCITMNKVYSYENNFYGPAIITNARILSKDRLNRFLIDENSFQWFYHTINGLESITITTLEDLLIALNIKTPKGQSGLFIKEVDYSSKENMRELSRYLSCHVQKIGKIKSKLDHISIYNVEIQCYTYLIDEKDDTNSIKCLITLGNLNCSGISD